MERLDACFGRLLSSLSSLSFDLVLQEMVATAIEDVAAVKALHISIDVISEG
jgi:hypothetical protein